MKYKILNNGAEVYSGDMVEEYPRGLMEYHDEKSIEAAAMLGKVSVVVEGQEETALSNSHNGYSGVGGNMTYLFGAEVYRMKNRKSHIRVKVWARPRVAVFHPSVQNRPY